MKKDTTEKSNKRIWEFEQETSDLMMKYGQAFRRFLLERSIEIAEQNGRDYRVEDIDVDMAVSDIINNEKYDFNSYSDGAKWELKKKE